MTIQEELQPASFKGVPFLATSTSTSGGRKTVTHEFVNSDKRNVEDLGLLQKTFTITGSITGPNYTSKRNNLIRVLDEGGQGELIHPFLGRANVVAKPYTFVENFDELGEAKFTLTFERSELNANPQPTGATQVTVDKLSDDAQDSLSGFVGEEFGVSSQFVRNYVAAEDLLNRTADAIDNASKFLTQNAERVDEAADTLTRFRNSIRKLINSPQELGDSLVQLYEALLSLSDIPGDISKSLNTLFDFGDDDAEIIPANSERQERRQNDDLIKATIKTLALVNSYREIVLIEFTTVDEIDEQQNRLDDLYQDIIDSLDIDSKADVIDLRNNARDYLDDQRISAKRIIEEETKEIPAQVLTFNLYGDLELNEEIIELNNIEDVSFVSGTVQVLS